MHSIIMWLKLIIKVIYAFIQRPHQQLAHRCFINPNYKTIHPIHLYLSLPQPISTFIHIGYLYFSPPLYISNSIFYSPYVGYLFSRSLFASISHLPQLSMFLDSLRLWIALCLFLTCLSHFLLISHPSIRPFSLFYLHWSARASLNISPPFYLSRSV